MKNLISDSPPTDNLLLDNLEEAETEPNKETTNDLTKENKYLLSDSKKTAFSGIAHDITYHFATPGELQSLTNAMDVQSEDILRLKQSPGEYQAPNNAREILENRHSKEQLTADIIADEIRHHYQQGTLPPFNEKIYRELNLLQQQVDNAQHKFDQTLRDILIKIQQQPVYQAADDEKIPVIFQKTRKKILDFLDQPRHSIHKLNAEQLTSLIGLIFIHLQRGKLDKDLGQQTDYQKFMRGWRQIQLAKQKLDELLVSPGVQSSYLGYRLGLNLEVLELKQSSDDQKALQDAITRFHQDPTHTSAVIYKFVGSDGWYLYNLHNPEKPHRLDDASIPPSWTRKRLLQSPKTLARLKGEIMRRHGYFTSRIEQLAAGGENTEQKRPLKIETGDQSALSLKEPKDSPPSSPTELKNSLFSSATTTILANDALGAMQLNLLTENNAKGDPMATASLVDILALSKFHTFIIWQQMSRHQLQPVHYFAPVKKNSDTTCHLLMTYPYSKIVLIYGEPPRRQPQEITSSAETNEETKERSIKIDDPTKKSPIASEPETQLVLYFSPSDTPTISVYARNQVQATFRDRQYKALTTALQCLGAMLPDEKTPEILLTHPQYIDHMARLCGIPAKYRILTVNNSAPLSDTGFNPQSPAVNHLKNSDIGLIFWSGKQPPTVKEITDWVQRHSELQGLLVVILYGDQVAVYGRNAEGNWQLTQEFNPQNFSRLTLSIQSDTQVSPTHKVILSKEVPIEIYTAIAEKKAHVPLRGMVEVYNVADNLAQHKRRRWQEYYFFLTVHAMHLTIEDERFLPWLEGLLGPNLQRYFNYALGKRGNRILSALVQYEKHIIDDLVQIIEQIKMEVETNILEYADSKEQGSEFSSGSSRLDHKDHKHKTPKKDHKDLDWKSVKEAKLKAAYRTWLTQDPRLLDAAFIRIRQNIHDSLIHRIKTGYEDEIRRHEAQHVQALINKQYQGCDLGLTEHFITPVTRQKVQLLLRLAENLLQRPCFNTFKQDWNWSKLIADISRLRYSGRRAQNANGSYFRLGDLLDEVNISRSITSTHNRHLTPLRMCEDFEKNLVLWLCKYLPADQDLQSLLGDVSSKNPFALESWAKDLVRPFLPAASINVLSVR